MGTSPVTLMPAWAAEVLSPGTEATDRGVKTEAYGTMGVGSLWLVDCERQRIETFANVRGRMVAGPVFGLAESVTGDPFGPGSVPVAEVLA
jgi:Uma2 family endonuclease